MKPAYEFIKGKNDTPTQSNEGQEVPVKVDLIGTTDDSLQDSIIDLRRRMTKLSQEESDKLNDYTIELVRRGPNTEAIFLSEKLTPELELYIWGEEKTAIEATIEGFKLVKSLDQEYGSVIQVDSDSDIKGHVYWMNKRQKARLIEFYGPTYQLGVATWTNTKVGIFLAAENYPPKTGEEL
jgi:hypothetical protein